MWNTGKKPPLIIIAGPTAVGKTELALDIAQRTGGEIISADSVQLYRGLDIGSAKIKCEETRGITHHLINCLDPLEESNVVMFQSLAKNALEDIYSRDRLPIICGGTGFYIQAVLYDIDFTKTGADPQFRSDLENKAKEAGGPCALWDRLFAIDPDAAVKIPVNNVRRTIRALEYFHLSNEPISRHNEREGAKEPPYNFALFVLTMERHALYEKINARVNSMISDGLLSEVMRLKAMGCTPQTPSMQAIGYKELMAALEEGDILTQERIGQAAELIKRNTRHFAKRQLTWFKREKCATWLDIDSFDTHNSLVSFCMDVLKKKSII